jgi:hypothetical protein
MKWWDFWSDSWLIFWLNYVLVIICRLPCRAEAAAAMSYLKDDRNGAQKRIDRCEQQPIISDFPLDSKFHRSKRILAYCHSIILCIVVSTVIPLDCILYGSIINLTFNIFDKEKHATTTSEYQLLCFFKLQGRKFLYLLCVYPAWQPQCINLIK